MLSAHASRYINFTPSQDIEGVVSSYLNRDTLVLGSLCFIRPAFLAWSIVYNQPYTPTLFPYRTNSVSRVFGFICPSDVICVLHGGRYVGVLKKFSSVVEGSVIEGQMDPAVVGKFKMTPLESSMASDLKKAAEANDSVSGLGPSLHRSACFVCFHGQFGCRFSPCW